MTVELGRVQQCLPGRAQRGEASMPGRVGGDRDVSRAGDVAVQSADAVGKGEGIEQAVVGGGRRVVAVMLAPGEDRVERHVLLHVLRVAEKEVLRLARQHEPSKGLEPFRHEIVATVYLERIPLRHFPRPVEDVARRLQAIAVVLGQHTGAGYPPLGSVHLPVRVSDRAQPLSLFEHAVRVVPPFARVRVQHVLRQQFPPFRRNHFQRLQNESDLRLGHEEGERQFRESGPQTLRVRLLVLLHVPLPAIK